MIGFLMAGVYGAGSVGGGSTGAGSGAGGARKTGSVVLLTGERSFVIALPGNQAAAERLRQSILGMVAGGAAMWAVPGGA